MGLVGTLPRGALLDGPPFGRALYIFIRSRIGRAAPQLRGTENASAAVTLAVRARRGWLCRSPPGGERMPLRRYLRCIYGRMSHAWELQRHARCR